MTDNLLCFPQREQLQQQLTEKVGPEMTHLVLELLHQKPVQRASAAEALDLLPCATLLHQRQQRQQIGAEDGNSTNEMVQQYAQQLRLQQDLLHPADSSSDHAWSSVDGVHTERDSAADCPAHLPPEEQPAGRRPWWGATLCRQVALRFCHCLAAFSQTCQDSGMVSILKPFFLLLSRMLLVRFVIGSSCTLTTSDNLCSMIECSNVWLVMQCSKGSRECRWLDASQFRKPPKEQCSGDSHWVYGTRLLGLEEALSLLSVYMCSVT